MGLGALLGLLGAPPLMHIALAHGARDQPGDQDEPEDGEEKEHRESNRNSQAYPPVAAS